VVVVVVVGVAGLVAVVVVVGILREDWKSDKRSIDCQLEQSRLRERRYEVIQTSRMWSTSITAAMNESSKPQNDD